MNILYQKQIAWTLVLVSVKVVPGQIELTDELIVPAVMVLQSE